jgi:hypothetical protein
MQAHRNVLRAIHAARLGGDDEGAILRRMGCNAAVRQVTRMPKPGLALPEKRHCLPLASRGLLNSRK